MDILNEKIEGLVKKAEKSKMPYSILKKVYDRGMAAWKTGHRPGTTPQQWAFARVNSFITKSSGTWGKADKDLAKQVRGEEVEKRTTAKEMIGQVKEKLPKDADAGDYVKDFRKSDAPQFKGKSDKKIQKMAIAAYLDSKEEVVKEENCPDCNEDPCKCKPLQESGHTDVPSMKTQVQIAMDALQKMNTELGKLSDEEELPTWWTNKVATAVGKLDGMADYIDAKHDQGQKMNEEINEQFVHTVRFEKEGMRFAVPFYDKQKAMDGKKVLQKSQGVSNLSVTQDILKPGITLSKRTQIEGKILPESKMGELFLDMQMDAQDMNEREFTKKYSKMGFQAAELKSLFKQFNEEVHPMVKAAALATTVWAERRHIDPADVDVKATAADRKAADKNIIIQLRRAQDMEKQTGRADQSGIEFLDKKKQKVDPKIINKALDMFDKMKPNDKQKMQQSIGKSYRDLLKTVQRGRV